MDCWIAETDGIDNRNDIDKFWAGAKASAQGPVVFYRQDPPFPLKEHPSRRSPIPKLSNHLSSTVRASKSLKCAPWARLPFLGGEQRSTRRGQLLRGAKSAEGAFDRALVVVEGREHM